MKRASGSWALRFGLCALGSLFCVAPIYAADTTTAGELITEPPTLLSLGFEWRIDGDDNRNAQVAVSYRKAGEQTWKAGPPLLRIGTERPISGRMRPGGRFRITDRDRSFVLGPWFFVRPGSIVLGPAGTRDYESYAVLDGLPFQSRPV